MSNEVSSQKSLLQVVSKGSQLLLSSAPDAFDAAMWSVLADLGHAAGADRAYVWAFSVDEVSKKAFCASRLYEWVSDSKYLMPSEIYSKRPFGQLMPRWVSLLAEKKNIQAAVRELPANEREELEPQGIAYVLAIPVFIQGELWGFFGLDNCCAEQGWNEEQVDVLSAAATLLGVAVDNHQGAERLRTANQRLRQSLQHASKLATEAKRANRIKSEFLANISHEIRTPMNAIMGLTYLMLEELPPGKNREYLVQIDSASRGLLQIIDDLLDVSKVEAGSLVLENSFFLLDDLLQNLSDSMLPKARRSGLSLTFDVAQDVPNALSGDSFRLRQILSNLVDNAIKFTNQGYVNVKIRVQEREPDNVILKVEVSDTGIGIAEDMREEIFKAFSQGDSSHTRKYGGTGLGLAISSSLVDMMQGEIHCEPNPGGGSVFWFTVRLDMPPRRRESDRATLEDDNIALGGNGTTRLDLEVLKDVKVLVVEDNEINQMIIAALLEEVGMDITLAQNGKDALEKLDKEHFDVVLMDIQMPEMDGLTATSCIRADGRFDNLPILAITAHAMPADFQRSIRAGMNGHVTKPVDPTLLYAELARWLAEQKG